MTLGDWINQYAQDNEAELLMLEPREQFDAAIVGICHRFNDTFVLYDRAKVIEIFAKDMTDLSDELDEDPETMAWEHFDFNVISGWVGEHTPAFVEYPPKDVGQSEGPAPTPLSNRPSLTLARSRSVYLTSRP